MFAKCLPSFTTRLGNGLTGTASSEAGFYNNLRPSLDLEAPHGYYCAFDGRSFRAIQLLEDLVETRQASFCTPTTAISREQAEDVVTQLARLHSQAARLNLTDDGKPGWLRTYPEWWKSTGEVAMIRRYHLRGQRHADELGITPRRLMGRGEQLWQNFEQSVHAHRKLPRTVLHGDTHLGNWYMTGGGRLGLCDWQCVSVGHWSRDLAYALATVLSVDQRRSWERELIDSYLDQFQAAHAVPRSEALELYRQQLTGALAMWTTTLRPPKFLPAMQPLETSVEMLRRILTAIDDHDVLPH
ncbi:aminoglycoside phosphotransferase [Mycolicibacterium rhodesiae JS60]|nr:aminoglycoside phosphotransferase [Mycolicibacterium rhodesiae JS60]